MDDETANLALKFYLDIAEVEGGRKGKQVDGQPSDAEVSFNLFRAELQQATQALSDCRIACSPVLAVHHDADLLTSMQEEKYVATQDHHLMRRLGIVPTEELQISEGLKDSDADKDLTNTFGELNISNREVYFYNEANGHKTSSSLSSSSSYHTAKSSETISKEFVSFVRTKSIPSMCYKLRAHITIVGVVSRA